MRIYPFLGSSRLEEPLSRYPVTMVFHGHAHHGRLEGRTRAQVPVYNVCLPLLQREIPDRPPFLLIDLEHVPVATGNAHGNGGAASREVTGPDASKVGRT